jgi:transposase-like protein
MEEKHDWVTMRKEYTQGNITETGVSYPTLQEIAERHGVNPSSLRRKAAEEDWTERRNIYVAKLEQKALEERTAKLAKEQAEWDFDIFKVTKNLLQYVKARMNEINRALAEDKVLPMPGETEQLTRIMRQIQELGKKALGDEGGMTPALFVELEDACEGFEEIVKDLLREALDHRDESGKPTTGNEGGLDSSPTN